MNSRRIAVLALLAAAICLPALISPVVAQAWEEGVGCTYHINQVDVTPRAVIMEPDGSAVTTFADYVPHAGGADIQIVKWRTEPGGPCKYWEAIYDSPSHYPDYVKAAARQANGKLFAVGYTDKTSVGKGKNWRIIKYSADGVFLWQAGYNGPASKDDVAEDAVMDYSTTPNSLYVAGWSTNADDTVSLVLRKYAPSSKVPLWTRRFDLFLASVGPGRPVHVGMGNMRRPHLTGTVWVTDPAGTHEAYFVAKYNPDDGALLDYKTIGYGAMSDGEVFYKCGHVFATGLFTVKLKVDPWGERWRICHECEHYYGRCLAMDNFTDPNFGNVDHYVYVSGPTSYAPQICYVKKYSNDGELLWTRYYDPGGGATAEVKCMTVDKSAGGAIPGSVVVAGEQSTGDGDWFAARWDPDGNLIWSDKFDHNGPGPDSAMAVTTDGSGNAWVTGYVQSNLNDRHISILKHTPEP